MKNQKMENSIKAYMKGWKSFVIARSKSRDMSARAARRQLPFLCQATIYQLWDLQSFLQPLIQPLPYLNPLLFPCCEIPSAC